LLRALLQNFCLWVHAGEMSMVRADGYLVRSGALSKSSFDRTQNLQSSPLNPTHDQQSKILNLKS
jgi:hypothetical protein